MLDDITIEKLEEMDPSLPYLLIRLSDIIDWGEEEFNLINESKRSFTYKCSKDFEEYHLGCCAICGDEDIDYYMVKNEIWEQFGVKTRMMCIPCLEEKIGRKLTAEDFTDAPVNDSCEFVKNLRKVLN